MFWSRNKFSIPNGLQQISTPEGCFFVGTQEQLLQLVGILEQISKLPTGTIGKLGRLSFCISNQITDKFSDENYVEMPAHSWQIMASKFCEVAYGEEESTFFFNSVGYLYPHLPYNVGVRIIDHSV